MYGKEWEFRAHLIAPLAIPMLLKEPFTKTTFGYQQNEPF
jgi:hypothetical protein